MIPLITIGATQACWWRKPLRAELDLNLDKMGEEFYEGGIQTWTGYISGGINGYMRFFLMEMTYEGPNGEWGHFKEIWQIFDEEGGTLLMQGYDEGYTHQPTGYYAMTGRVTDTSSKYAKWDGHIVFMHGRIIPPPAEWPPADTWPPFPVAEAPGYFHLF